MKNRIILVLMVFAVTFLTACASNGLIIPKTISGVEKTYTVTEEGTVEIIGQDMNIEPKHWVFVECNHWSGCFMTCQGKINSCKKVATDSGLKISYIDSGE